MAGERVKAIKASGGVVWRRTRTADDADIHPIGPDQIEVVVVHRPAYDDWTLPKGKRKSGEKGRDCALREVEEETGLRCCPGAELPPTSYLMPDGNEKALRWWSMTVAEDLGFESGDEVDEVRWVRASEVDSILTYQLDATVVGSFLERVNSSG